MPDVQSPSKNFKEIADNFYENLSTNKIQDMQNEIKQKLNFTENLKTNTEEKESKTLMVDQMVQAETKIDF